MTPHDTAAALEAALAEWASAVARGFGSATKRAARDRALTAHVEAEVARRLATALPVDLAIEEYGDACQAWRNHHGPTLGPIEGALRAAIAADKAQAVEAARPTPDEARRLVEEFEQACDAFQYREADARTTARAALIAALVGKDP